MFGATLFSTIVPGLNTSLRTSTARGAEHRNGPRKDFEPFGIVRGANFQLARYQVGCFLPHDEAIATQHLEFHLLDRKQRFEDRKHQESSGMFVDVGAKSDRE